MHILRFKTDTLAATGRDHKSRSRPDKSQAARKQSHIVALDTRAPARARARLAPQWRPNEAKSGRLTESCPRDTDKQQRQRNKALDVGIDRGPCMKVARISPAASSLPQTNHLDHETTPAHEHEHQHQHWRQHQLPTTSTNHARPAARPRPRPITNTPRTLSVADFSQSLATLHDRFGHELQMLVETFRKRNGELRKER